MISKTIEELRKFLGTDLPKTCIVLGSGLGVVSSILQNKRVISYNKLTNFPKSTVVGHSGNLILGWIDDVPLLLMQGRKHFYEGISLEKLTLPIRVFSQIGIKNLILTSASGAVNKDLKPGDIMLLNDHINFTFKNPIIGRRGQSIFVDTSECYNIQLQNIAKEAAKEKQIDLKEGVYFYMSGPTYETPAEVKMIRLLGGDVAGMSTFPEAIEAHTNNIKVMGITYVSNMGAGITDNILHHDEVMETMSLIEEDVKLLLETIVKKINTYELEH